MDFSFLKEETFGLRTQKTFVGNKCEIYLPEYFFNKNNDKAIAADLGDRIRTIGLFYFSVDGSLYNLSLPISFEFQFTEVNKKKFKIKPNLPELSYFVYTLKRGDAFMYDVLHKRSVDDFKFFINKLIENAKMPLYVSYEESLDIFMQAMIATQTTGSLGVSSVSIEFMLSELYRSKKNMQNPFRLDYNGKNEYDFKMVDIRKIPQLNSTFTGIMGEDINTQIVSAVVKTREKLSDKETPIEKIIKY